MTVLVRNELADPWIFEGSHGSRQIAPGQVAVISDEEWATIITAKRGPSGLHALSNNPGSRSKTLFDYTIFNLMAQILYLGQAAQDAATSSEVWTIRKFAWQVAADGSTQIDSVQVLDTVSWDDRDSLPWT